jgi:hypothetical protein
LPLDIIGIVVGFLPANDRRKVATVCKTLNYVVLELHGHDVLERVVVNNNIVAVRSLIERGHDFGRVKIQEKDVLRYTFDAGKDVLYTMFLHNQKVRARANVDLLLVEVARKCMKHHDMGFTFSYPMFDQLLQIEGLDLTQEHQLAFTVACMMLPAETVKKLMANPSINPGADANRAFKEAARCGRNDVLTVLLTSDRGGPFGCRNSSIPWGFAHLLAPGPLQCHWHGHATGAIPNGCLLAQERRSCKYTQRV